MRLVLACVARKVELLISDDTASFVSLFAPHPLTNASRAALALRARQHACAASPAECARIARAITAAKIKKERHAKTVERAFLAALRQAKTTDDVRHVEAQAAQIWWKQWEVFKLQFQSNPPIPSTWRTWPGRYIGRRQGMLGEKGTQFTARGAVHPMQAMLNLAVAVVAARITRVVIARGLDPAFGFLHDGRKPGRLSLVWDVVEPMRPPLVQAVFKFAAGQTFVKQDFRVFVDKGSGRRVVRLTAPLARDLVCVAMRAITTAEVVQEVKVMEKWILA